MCEVLKKFLSADSQKGLIYWRNEFPKSVAMLCYIIMEYVLINLTRVQYRGLTPLVSIPSIAEV